MQPSFVAPALTGQLRGPVALLGDAMRRRGGRRALSALSAVLFVAGLGLFAYPLFTDLYQQHVQSDLRHRFTRPAEIRAYRDHAVPVGAGLVRLRIRSIGLDVVVVEGTTATALRAGAGHYQGTPLPGEPGNVAIAGHRTTYGHPFNRLDEVRPGASIELETPTGVFVYRSVLRFDGQSNPHPVAPTDTAVIAPPADPAVRELTLTTCNPKGSASQRLILRALLESANPAASPPDAA